MEAKGIAVGQCSIEAKDDDAAEIGYWIRSDRANQGIATKAIRALLAAAVDHGFVMFSIHCDEGNVRSAAVAKKLGFTHVRTVDLDPTLPGTNVQTRREMTWTLSVQAARTETG